MAVSSTYRGYAAAAGVGIGVTLLYRTGHFTLERTSDVSTRHPDAEWRRFLAAQKSVDAELAQLAQGSNSLVAEVFAAHRTILQDQMLADAVRTAVYEDGRSAAGATFRAINELAALVSGLDDAYFAGRAADILDIGKRLLAQLGATAQRPRLDSLPDDTILVADDLTPSDVAQLQPESVRGIALAESTPTAHSAILARSLGIPMVCGLGDECLRTLTRRPAIVDGDRGLLIVNPDGPTVRYYHAERQSVIEERALAARHAHEPAFTRDGVRIPVLANANSPDDVRGVTQCGAEGIGLLRTEYLFEGRQQAPTVNEQADAYALFLRQVGSGPLTVRALDAGGDKPVRFVNHPREENPFLGLRGLRLLLVNPELLRTQYRALQLAARAVGATGQARLLLPMVTTLQEVLDVRALVADCHGDLPPLPLGVMVEVPSSALIAGRIAPHVDFFSIGTNDLAQYTFASDRTHRSVGALANPLHPAVLRLIEMTCRAGQEAGVPVSLCGEMGGDPTVTPLLLGLGVQELSAALPNVALVKEAVRRTTLTECRMLAQRALECADADAVRSLLE